MSEMHFIYQVENIKNGNITFTTNPMVAETLHIMGYKVTCKNYMKVKKVKH